MSYPAIELDDNYKNYAPPHPPISQPYPKQNNALLEIEMKQVK